VAKPSGIVIIWDHNKNNPYWPILMRRLPQDSGDERIIPLREITDALNKSGVEKIEVYKKGFVPDFD